MRVNYSLNLILGKGTLVGIPIDFTNLAQTLYFQSIMIRVQDSTAEDLINKIAISPDAFKYYNGFYDGKK